MKRAMWTGAAVLCVSTLVQPAGAAVIVDDFTDGDGVSVGIPGFVPGVPVISEQGGLSVDHVIGGLREMRIGNSGNQSAGGTAGVGQGLATLDLSSATNLSASLGLRYGRYFPGIPAGADYLALDLLGQDLGAIDILVDHLSGGDEPLSLTVKLNTSEPDAATQADMHFATATTEIQGSTEPQWVRILLDGFQADAGFSFGEVDGIEIDFGAIGVGSLLSVDEIRFVAVPEPAVGTLVLAGVGASLIRRRKA